MPRIYVQKMKRFQFSAAHRQHWKSAEKKNKSCSAHYVSETISTTTASIITQPARSDELSISSLLLTFPSCLSWPATWPVAMVTLSGCTAILSTQTDTHIHWQTDTETLTDRHWTDWHTKNWRKRTIVNTADCEDNEAVNLNVMCHYNHHHHHHRHHQEDLLVSLWQLRI